MIVYCQLDPKEHISMELEIQRISFNKMSFATMTTILSWPQIVELVFFFVSDGPEWVDYAVTKFAGREGSSASIECRFRAMPSPIYSWSRLGAQLIPGSGVNIVTTAQGSTVHLDSVLSSQLGFYICRATNEHMSLEKELMLLEPGGFTTQYGKKKSLKVRVNILMVWCACWSLT